VTTRVLFSLCLLLAAAACGSDTGNNPTPPATCTVSAVTISPGTVTVPIAQTTTLAPTITQQNCGTLTPTWSSSNQSVATVSSSGLVTALATGTSTITATVNSVQGSAIVTVPPCATAITLNPTTLTIAVPLTVNISASVAPSTCPPATITWTSSSTAIATVGNGNVTAVSPGTATITASIGTTTATATVTIVSAQLGSVWDQSTLRVAGGNDAPSGFIAAAWAASPTDVFAASFPNFYRYNGSTWATLSGDAFGVEAMWGSSASDVFGVGQTIRRFNGTAWVEMTAPTTQRLRAVWGSSSTNVFAVGQNGTIIRYNGTAWSTMSSPTTANLVGISGASANLIFAVAENGSILRYDGTTWTVVVPPSSDFLTGVWMANATLGYAVGSGGVLKFNGTTWALDPAYTNVNGVLRTVWGSSPTNVIVAGEAGFMSRYDGTSWSALPRRTGGQLSTLTGSGSTAFAIGGNVVVQQAGSTTTLLTSAPELRSVWAVDANTAFAVGHDGTIWRYNNGTWQLQPRAGFTRFEDVYAASATQVLAIGTDPLTSESVAYRYDGSSWQRTTLSGVGSLVSLWGPTFSNVFAGSRFSPLQRFDGSTWSNATATPPGDLNALWGTSENDVLLVGSGGFAGRYSGGGVFTPIATGTTSALVSVWGSSPTNYFAGTNNGGMFRYNGSSFTPMTLPGQSGGIYGLWGVSATQVYAVDFNGAVYRYDGTQWVRLRDTVGDAFFWSLHGVPSKLFAVGPGGSVMVTR
jgi:trimeric autotransporter adhesin